MKVTLEQIAEKIKCAKKIAVYGHIKTDCDCVGGMLAFKIMCERLGKHVDLFVDSEFGETLLHLPGLNEINSATKKQYDLLVSLDTATAERLGKFRNEFVLHKNTVRIDHHATEEPYSKFEYVNEKLPSNCLILRKLQKLLGVEDCDKIKFLLLSGVLADTGCFRFNSTNPETLQIGADIFENANFEWTDVVIPLFQNVSKKKRLLQGRALSNAQFFENDQIALLFISNSDLKEFGATLADSGQMSFQVLDISTVKIAIAVTEGRPGEFSVTFYSKGSLDISVCAKAFGGGGHTGAAGCKLFGTKSQILPKLVAEAQKVIRRTK